MFFKFIILKILYFIKDGVCLLENEYTKTYSLWKDHGHTTIYAVFTVDEDYQIGIDVCEENGDTYGLFYHSINEPIVQELLTKLLKILKTLNAHTVISKGENNE